jgi:hypothetical protein
LVLLLLLHLDLDFVLVLDWLVMGPAKLSVKFVSIFC